MAEEPENSIYSKVRALLRAGGYRGAIPERIIEKYKILYEIYGDDLRVVTKNGVSTHTLKFEENVTWRPRQFETKRLNSERIGSDYKKPNSLRNAKSKEQELLESSEYQPLRIISNMNEELLPHLWLYNPGDTQEAKEIARSICMARGDQEPGIGWSKGPLLRKVDEKGDVSFSRTREKAVLNNFLQYSQISNRASTTMRSFLDNTRNNSFVQGYIKIVITPEENNRYNPVNFGNDDYQDPIGDQDPDDVHLDFYDCYVTAWLDPEKLIEMIAEQYLSGIKGSESNSRIQETRAKIEELTNQAHGKHNPLLLEEIRDRLKIEREKLRNFEQSIRVPKERVNQIYNTPISVLISEERKKSDFPKRILSCCKGQVTIMHNEGWFRGYHHRKFNHLCSARNGPMEILEMDGTAITRRFYKDDRLIYDEKVIPVNPEIGYVSEYGYDNEQEVLIPANLEFVRKGTFFSEKNGNIVYTVEFHGISDVVKQKVYFARTNSWEREFQCRLEGYDEKGDLKAIRLDGYQSDYTAEIEIQGEFSTRTILDKMSGETIRIDVFENGEPINSDILNPEINEVLTQSVGVNLDHLDPFGICEKI